MDIAKVWALQCTMFLLMIAGAVMKKKKILGDGTKDVLTNLAIDLILPCNIINSFRAEFDMSILAKFAMVFLVSVGVQVLAMIISHTCYNNRPDQVKRVFQYSTIVSNSGFLGLPVIEGVLGAEALMYASIFLIPMRVMMWSAGISCFTESPDFKSVCKKLALHPCIVALYIGLPMLFFQKPLGEGYAAFLASAPALCRVPVSMFVTAADKFLRSAGGCTTTITMVLVGTMFSELKAKDLLTADGAFITVIRQGVMPGITLLACRLCGVNPLVTSVSVLMTAMPIGSTGPILAAKYGCDYTVATKCLIFSTLMSMVTIPVWCMIL